MKSSIKKIIYLVLLIRNILQYITKGRNVSLIQFNLVIQIVVLKINDLILLINLLFLIYLLMKEIEGKPSLIRSLSLNFLLFLTIIHNF